MMASLSISFRTEDAGGHGCSPADALAQLITPCPPMTDAVPPVPLAFRINLVTSSDLGVSAKRFQSGCRKSDDALSLSSRLPPDVGGLVPVQPALTSICQRAPRGSSPPSWRPTASSPPPVNDDLQETRSQVIKRRLFPAHPRTIFVLPHLLLFSCSPGACSAVLRSSSRQKFDA